MTVEQCGNCRYWERDAFSLHGYCRRRAPTTTGLGWPKTMDDEWCGEWQAKQPEAPKPPAMPVHLMHPDG